MYMYILITSAQVIATVCTFLKFLATVHVCHFQKEFILAEVNTITALTTRKAMLFPHLGNQLLFLSVHKMRLYWGVAISFYCKINRVAIKLLVNDKWYESMCVLSDTPSQILPVLVAVKAFASHDVVSIFVRKNLGSSAFCRLELLDTWCSVGPMLTRHTRELVLLRCCNPGASTWGFLMGATGYILLKESQVLFVFYVLQSTRAFHDRLTSRYKPVMVIAKSWQRNWKKFFFWSLWIFTFAGVKWHLLVIFPLLEPV